MSETPAAPSAPSASATPATASARRSAPGWLWFLLIAVLAGGGYFYYDRHKEQVAAAEAEKKAAEEKKGKGKGMGGPTPVVAAPARKGELNVHIYALGTVTPLRTVTVRSRVDGQLMRVHFRRGRSRQAGPAARGDRSAAVQRAAEAGRGTARARPGAARECAPRPRALSHAALPGLDRQAAGRFAGSAGAAVRGRRQVRPEPGRERAPAADLCARHGADQRAGRPAPGRSRQHRARAATPTASSSSRSSRRSAWSSPCRRTVCRR